MKVEHPPDDELVRAHESVTQADTQAYDWLVSDPLYVAYTGWLAPNIDSIRRTLPQPRSARQRRNRRVRTRSCSRGDPDPAPPGSSGAGAR